MLSPREKKYEFKIVFVYDTETYPNEGIRRSITHVSSFDPKSKNSSTIRNRNLTQKDIYKILSGVEINHRSDCIDEKLQQVIGKRIVELQTVNRSPKVTFTYHFEKKLHNNAVHLKFGLFQKTQTLHKM